MARLSKLDWIIEGEQILREFAQDKIKILYLCERLKVTRGSFYHHFKSIEEYIDDLLLHWKTSQTSGFIELAEGAKEIEEKFEKLNKAVFNADHTIEAAIRSWSFYNAVVKKHLDEVDELRLSFLTKMFVEWGTAKEEAIGLARIEYATLIGLQQLKPTVKSEELEQLFALHKARMKD